MGKNKIIIFSFLCFLYSINLHSQGTFKALRLRSGGLQFIASSPNKGVVIATGEFGIIRRSVDDGKTWETKFLNTDLRNLTSTSFFDEKILVSCGTAGICMRSEDMGVVWEKIPMPTQANLTRVATDKNGFGIACGDGGVIVRTTDYGKSWSKIETGYKFRLNDVRIQQGTAIAVGDTNLILRSTDNGQTWESMGLPVGEKSVCCATPKAGKWFIFTQDYTAYLESDDDGRTWSENLSDTNTTKFSKQEGYFKFAEFRDSLFGMVQWIGYSRGQFTAYTQDGGKTWVSKDYPTFLFGAESFVYLKNGNILSVGAAGDRILGYKNIQYDNNRKVLFDYYSIDSDSYGEILYNISPDFKTIVYEEILGRTSKIYKTQADWKSSTKIMEEAEDTISWNDTFQFGKIYVKSNNEYWVYAAHGQGEQYDYGWNDMIFRTTDGGLSFEKWIDEKKFPEFDMNTKIEFIDKNLGFAFMSDSAWIYRTTDGGNSWHRFFNIPETYEFRDIMDVQRFGDLFLFETWGAPVILYYNYKENRIVKQFRVYCDYLRVLSPTKLVSIVSDTVLNYLRISNDGGESWKTVYSSPHRYLYEVQLEFRDSLNGVLVSDAQLFIYTTDGGNSWQEVHNHYFLKARTDIYDVNYTDKGVMFSTGGSNMFLWEPPGIGAVPAQSQGQNREFSILPNPVKDKLKIRLPEKYKEYEEIELKIINSIGEEVKQIKLSQGKESVDVSEISNGVYSLIIKSGNEVYHQNMVVVK